MFLFIVWEHLGLPKPTKIQLEIAHYLQHGGKRTIVQAFRGVGKSWITSAYVLWCLLRNKDEKFLIVSANKQRADDFSTFCHRLINDMPILWHLSPSSQHRSSKLAWDVGTCKPAHAPSVKSAGIFGQITGSRATKIIADDIEVGNNSNTQDMREKLIHTVAEFNSILVPEGHTSITFLGTPHTEESLYNHLHAEKGYLRRIWTGRVPKVGKIDNYYGCLAPSIEERYFKGDFWKPVDIQRFSDTDLKERQLSSGLSNFMLQFMLDTTLADLERYPLKLSDIIFMNTNPSLAPVIIQYGSSKDQQIRDLRNIGFTGDKYFKPMFMSPEWAAYEGSVMYVDPSGRGKDETTYAVVKQLHGNLYLTAAGGFTGGYEENTLIGLSKIAKKEKVNKVICEDNFGDGMFTKLFQPILNRYYPLCSIEEDKAFKQKEVRIIETLEPILNQHKLVVNKEIIERELAELEKDEKKLPYLLFYQLTRITKEKGCLKHDDRLDAVAGAVKYWTEYMSRDSQKAAKQWQEKQLINHAHNFLDEVLTIQDTVSLDKHVYENKRRRKNMSFI